MSERKEAFFRLLVLIVSGIILYLWAYVICVLAVFHWLFVIIVGKRNKSIGDFVEYWNTETYRFYRYVTGVTNERPFPFTSVQHMSKFK